MPDSIDDLARRWKAQPDASGAVYLCDTLRNSSPAAWTSLVDEIGKLAAAKHAENGSVLLAVARLYAAVDRLSDAQGLLVSAGRVAPRDAHVFRMLGEVLLRRGDAERAEKVLQRAKQLGASDAETSMWLDRAKVFKPVQAKAGARAVAIEVKNTSVHPVTPHPDLLPRARPRVESIDQDGVTVIRGALPAEVGALFGDETVPAPSAAKKPPPPKKPLTIQTEATVPRGVLSFPRDVPADAPLDVPDGFMQRPTGPKLSSDGASPTEAPAVARAAPPPPRDVAIAVGRTDDELGAGRDPMPTFTDERTEISEQPDAFVPRAPAQEAAPVADLVNSVPAAIPTAKEVLDALAFAGVFEAREAISGPIVWDRPNEKARRRTAIGLGVGLVVFMLGSVGVFEEIHRRRALAHDEAETVLAKVEADLNASKPSLLPGIEQSIGRAFELDSRSPRAAADWLEERAVKGLLSGGADLAFEDAVTRALEVKVPEEQVAYARVAAFLFQGDTGGAAGLMPKWDTPAASQPLYQLITGATLEHAGDPHAGERYQAAAKLAPNLVLADILLGRATAIDGDPTKAADLAKQFKAKYPDRPEGSALVALAWGRDPARGEQPPPEVADTIAHTKDLPLPLLAVPHALAAILAADKHAYPDAKAEIEKGLAVADDPGVATWLGSIALETHDEPLVRKAALLAVTFSAVYAPARVLAARIALLGGRLDEALKATEDLDPTSPDVAIVRAAAAYERADADGVGRALEATSADAKKLPSFSALNLASDALLGHETETWPAADAQTKLSEMSSDEAPWSDLIAMDVALDLGLTDVADKILADWKGTEEKPLKAVRLSRLARYENRLDDADHLSKVAVDTATVTPRVLIERVMLLVAKNRAPEVGPLLARYPLVLGPASSWLSAYALASTGKLDEARGRTAQLDFPPPLSPLPLRIVAAVSLAAMKDKKRAEPAIKGLLAAGSADPDLLAAAASIGIKTVAKPAVKPKPKK